MYMFHEKFMTRYKISLYFMVNFWQESYLDDLSRTRVSLHVAI